MPSPVADIFREMIEDAQTSISYIDQQIAKDPQKPAATLTTCLELQDLLRDWVARCFVPVKS